MSGQEKVKDNTGLGYFSKYAGTAILQDSTSENDVSANKRLKPLKSAFLTFKVKIMCLKPKMLQFVVAR